MTAVLTYLIPVLAGGAALAGIYFLFQAVRERTEASRAPYSVGKQHAHHAMQIDLARAAFSFVIALILLGISGLSPRPVEGMGSTPVERLPTLTPTEDISPPPAILTRNTLQAVPSTIVPASPTVSPTVTPDMPPPTPPSTAVPPTPMPTMTSTPEPLTAIVSSEVGVYLRAEPSTETDQLAWLLQGTTVLVLPETAAAENLAWQQVQTQEGLVGWVAIPFINYNNE